MNNYYVVILAGGEGTRFAPYSSPEKPKQFLEITQAGKTMIQQTWERARGLVPPANILVSTNQKYKNLVLSQLPEITEDKLILEPVKKNTAPAIALATWMLARKNPEAQILFLPSDHYIANLQSAQRVWRQAFEFCESSDGLVTFGVPPTFPSSDYGYLLKKDIPASTHAYPVDRFVEKPDVQRAEEYLKSGLYLWNSGMFAWKAKVFLGELKIYLPDMFNLLESANFFNRVQSISIDYGVMERSKKTWMIPFDAGWSDVGTWQGLKDLQSRYQLTLPPILYQYLST